MEKKAWTQKEKIAYYAKKVARAQYILEQFERSLERVMSENYQDFNGELPKELAKKRKGG